MKKLLQTLFMLSGAVLAACAVYFTVMFLRLRLSPAESASVGIIGGADGPTAVFVASQTGLGWLLLPALVFAVSGIMLLIRRLRAR